ncbi:WXG100 family type VII secretion target [Micromonospora maritima]|uniref:WXG100 family type VII secretion target n=1 Tax=Micromonospora maritima TaxID=986711 RepID=UPI0037888414
MTGGIEVDVVTLRAAARTIRGGGERLTGEVQRLQGTVSGSGNPWGGDEAGTVFGMAYTEVLQHALDAYASMADQLMDVAERLDTVATDHERTDMDNAALFRGLELPGGPAITT